MQLQSSIAAALLIKPSHMLHLQGQQPRAKRPASDTEEEAAHPEEAAQPDPKQPRAPESLLRNVCKPHLPRVGPSFQATLPPLQPRPKQRPDKTPPPASTPAATQ